MSQDTTTGIAIDIRQRLRNPASVAGAVLLVGAFAFPYLPGTGQYEVFLLGQILAFAIAALAYNVLLGYTGLLSFGHAAFFGGSAYAIGLAMEYTGMSELLLLVPLGVLTAGLIAVVIGYISVRHTEVYYALLMLALAHLIYVITVKLYTVTGGTDGVPITTPTIAGVDYLASWGYAGYLMGVLYYVILIAFVITMVLLWTFMHSPFGLTLKTIRDDPERARAIGIPVRRYRWYASIVSGLFTGLGGAMYAILNGHVTPGTVLHWSRSGELAFMTVLGGTGWFFGPITGAGAFILIRSQAQQLTEYWHFLMGLVLFLVIVFEPEGLSGIGARVRRRVRQYRNDGGER
ncbi:branched-chain amino acid ABC transporter permease [Natrinema sp. 1APR25-10V2]|uniref:branched-chain amino acid ABC transporter permease n=1 Tax=Natrinema sp. 1APR25-10V2 TaxID=2951081 RepID=UPI00287514A8|nr:branched-chain amino acid ABC transporter permease [Natrinema sp. 1APR25-10V2]MDS0477027.1 branched-chain amino acid ABC transporter permease [Natrinema sp. 1APR25-10V2]